MPDDVAISVEDLWKRYRLGALGAGTLQEDVAAWWARRRGRPDPRAPVHGAAAASGREAFWALRGLELEVGRGEVVGLIGANGAGKSTLLKILSRITAPTRGRVRLRGRVASLLEVGTGFHPDLSGRDNVRLNGAIMGMTRREIEAELPRIVEFSGCGPHMDTPVKRYSSGMVVRLGFAVAAHLRSEILIVDEVLAVGDRAFHDRCVEKMRSLATGEGRTVVFVSHNMGTVRALCESGIVLEEGRATRHDDVDAAIRAYAGDSGDGPLATRREFVPREDRPTITGVELDHDAGGAGGLEVRIAFVSPWPIVPIPGLVVSDEAGRPVFGTNGRLHDVAGSTAPTTAGTLVCRHDALPLHGGRYAVSVWLGDMGGDHDARESVVGFEIPSVANWVGARLREVVGPLDLPPRWSREDASEGWRRAG